MSKTKDKSYYDILGVSKDATEEEIKKKRKVLIQKYHPDKMPTEKKEWAEELIKEINEAYEILSNPKKRDIYDRYGKEGLNANEGDGNFNPDEIFSHFFGQKRKSTIPPIKVPVDVTLEEIFKGKNVTKPVERYGLCETCNNTGFEDKQKHTCKNCKGKGILHVMRQLRPGMLQQLQIECEQCDGTGNDKSSQNIKKCKLCEGNGVIKEKYAATIKIEPGTCKGDIIEIENEGHELPKEIQDKQKRGSIIFVINEVSHEIYKRGVVLKGSMNPANLAMDVTIELHEALCGFVKCIKYLDGSDIYIDQHEVTKDGELKIIIGKGLPYKNKPYKYGDLFVKFHVNYPKFLTENTKGKIYELLTYKKYDSSSIHKIPKDKFAIDLKNVDNYNVEHYQCNDDDDDDDEDGCTIM